MKKIFILIFLFSIAKAQYTDRIDTASTLPPTGTPLHKYVSGGNVYIFAEGQWRLLEPVVNAAYSTSTFSTGTIDTTKVLPIWQIGLYTLLTDSRLTDTRIPRAHSHSATDITGTAVLTNDSRLSDSRIASDVSAWAKASLKPTYTPTEVGLGNVTNNAQWYSGNHPTTTTDYGLPDYPTTLPASDVYSWAKSATKPSYTYTEVGAMDSNRALALRGVDTIRAIAREALKQNIIIGLNNMATQDSALYYQRTLADAKYSLKAGSSSLTTFSGGTFKSGAGWDTTAITFGTVTIPAGDSIQVSITGLTATSVATTAYRGGRMTADTMATWQIPANGKITIYGKYNKVIGYSVKR